MGGNFSQVFKSGSALLSKDGNKVSDGTTAKIKLIFDVLRANPKIPIQRVEDLLLQIPKNENILSIHDEAGYNLLQKCVGLNHIEFVRYVLHRFRPDLNRSPCSLPLHIACLKGYEECVELLLKYGARIDTEARMCFPGDHSANCEESGKYKGPQEADPCGRAHKKLQNALCYALDGDQINVLNILSQKIEEPWLPFRVNRKPLLHLACEKGAWRCVQQLVITRSDEINIAVDEYYPIHQAVLHDSHMTVRFIELLIAAGADVCVRTSTQQMTLLHVVILATRKSADDTLSVLRILLERGCKELINAPDSLSNTPLHALIVRYALEEAKYGYDKWNKWDILHLVRFFLQSGARISINQTGNSALACVFRHIRDWEVCYELLNMLIKEEGDPNIVGRDGSVPLMVCLVPLINKDPLHNFTHSMKVCYMNCIRILLQHGGNPNCSYRSNLTPLHVLIFTVSENFTLNCDIQKRSNFDFVKNILILLLQHGLDCNIASHHILQSVLEMIQNVRSQSLSLDLSCLYELTLTLLQYGADPNVCITNRISDIHLHEFLHEHDRAQRCRGTECVPGSNPDTAGENLRNSFRNNGRNYLLLYFIMLIVRKEFILFDTEHTYSRIIYLFYLSMQHEPLYCALKSLHKLFIVHVPQRAIEHNVSKLITTLYKGPRTLKQMCRVTIYQNLNRKLAQNVNRLQLPSQLKDYILNFDL